MQLILLLFLCEFVFIQCLEENVIDQDGLGNSEDTEDYWSEIWTKFGGSESDYVSWVEKISSKEYASSQDASWSGEDISSGLKMDSVKNSRDSSDDDDDFKPSGGFQVCKKLDYTPTISVADLDWRDRIPFPPLKNANNSIGNNPTNFVIADALEVHYRIRYNRTSEPLSEQQMTDCNTLGVFNEIYYLTSISTLINLGGIETKADYPTTKVRNRCAFNQSKVALSFDCERVVVGNEDHMGNAVDHLGPLIVGVRNTHWKGYKGGIINGSDCDSVDAPFTPFLLIGYVNNPMVDVPYWILRSAWGEDFGERGYVRMELGRGCRDIGLMNIRPIVNNKK